MAVAIEGQRDSRGRLRSDSQTVNDQPSLTIQSDADEADIQKILSKFEQVGIVDNLNRADAMFLDVSEFTDFADLTRQTKAAELEFMKLPSKQREIFGHDVANWLDAAHDQEKRDALVADGDIEADQPDVAGVEQATPKKESAPPPEQGGGEGDADS